MVKNFQGEYSLINYIYSTVFASIIIITCDLYHVLLFYMNVISIQLPIKIILNTVGKTQNIHKRIKTHIVVTMKAHH